ncbi:MAG: flavodoxin family protein [Defluviitaleaceae bacterium]|nr:flavodoxin family protein [Defluviitaleaceae bacterium]
MKTLIIQDIDQNGIDVDLSKYTLFQMSERVKPCVGCFGCWIKTPGKCVIKDGDNVFLELMPKVDKVMVISKLTFGGFSPDIKGVFDRSIGFILPFFETVSGEMHHKQRYEKRPSLQYMFYGDNMTEAEKATAQKLVKANAVNLGAPDCSASFYATPDEILEGLK